MSLEAPTARIINPETRQLLTDLFGKWDGHFPKPGLDTLVELPEYQQILRRFKDARDNGETLHLRGFRIDSESFGQRKNFKLDFKPKTFKFGYIVKDCYTSGTEFVNGRSQKVKRGPHYTRIYDVIATGKFENGVARCISLSDLLPVGHEQRAEVDLKYPNKFLQIVENQ